MFQALCDELFELLSSPAARPDHRRTDWDQVAPSIARAESLAEQVDAALDPFLVARGSAPEANANVIKSVAQLLAELAGLLIAAGRRTEAEAWLRRAHERAESTRKSRLADLYRLGLTMLDDFGLLAHAEFLARTGRLDDADQLVADVAPTLCEDAKQMFRAALYVP